MENKAWPYRTYTCCKGNVKCSNNQTMKLADELYRICIEDDEGKARNALYDTIANRDELIDWQKYKIKQLKEKLNGTQEK